MLYAVAAFEIGFSVVLVGALAGFYIAAPDTWVDLWLLPAMCATLGGFGGAAYCLRAIYLNACVYKRWDTDWLPWYFIRPFVSIIFGGVSFLFLKVGLLALDASHGPDGNPLGFLALAFIAGLNVDRFMARIEATAQAAWGVRPSRTTESSGEERDDLGK